MTSRRQAMEGLSRRLDALGYCVVPGPISGAARVAYKLVGDLILTLGIQVSTRHSDRFTAAFYVSRSFEWGYVPDGFPERAYQRLGRLLTAEERVRLLDPFYSQAGVVDAWWIGFDAPVLSAFSEAVALTGPRFLGQPGLIDAVVQCDALRRHRVVLDEVAQEAGQLRHAPAELEHQPRNHLEAAGLSWYWAAEVVLRRRRPEALGPDFVSLVALDAWRVATLLRSGSSTGR